MGLPGLAYLTGVANPAWTAIGLGIGTWFNWLIVARRLRRYSANINAITVPEFYSKRYHDNSNVLNAIAALVIIVFSYRIRHQVLRPAVSFLTAFSVLTIW